MISRADGGSLSRGRSQGNGVASRRGANFLRSFLQCMSPHLAHHIDRTIQFTSAAGRTGHGRASASAPDLQNGKVVSTSANTFTMLSANVTLTRQRKSRQLAPGGIPRKDALNQCVAFLGARLRTGSAPHGLFPSHRGRSDRPRPWSFSRIAPGRSPLPHRLARLHAIGDACGQDTLPIGPAQPPLPKPSMT